MPVFSSFIVFSMGWVSSNDTPHQQFHLNHHTVFVFLEYTVYPSPVSKLSLKFLTAAVVTFSNMINFYIHKGVITNFYLND